MEVGLHVVSFYWPGLDRPHPGSDRTRRRGTPGSRS